MEGELDLITVRRVARRAAERVVVASGLPTLSRRARHGQCLVLAYHNVVPDGAASCGDAPLHLRFADFRAQMAHLVRHHQVVPLTALEGGPSDDRPRVAVTFDDAYASALELAVPHATSLGIPVTIFVAPGILGRQAMWWDVLARPSGGLPQAIRNRALGEFRGEHDRILEWALGQDLKLMEPHPVMRIATDEELRRVARLPGVTLGLHSWGHPNLAALSHQEVADELTSCIQWLGWAADLALLQLAYPYGSHSPATQLVADRLSIERAFTVDAGWVHGSAAPTMALPRLNVPAGMSMDGFALRASGIGLR